MTDTDASAVDNDRAEYERGLRFGHIMLMVNQSQNNEMLAALMALVDILVAKGDITEEQFEEYRARAKEQMQRLAQPRVRLAHLGDKYADPQSAEIDCAARLHLCHARCCSFYFYLTTQDVEEGVARWDYGNPYWIKRGADGYCTHCDPETRFCAIHERRPHVCRLYDCRNDERVWIDFEARIPAPMPPVAGPMSVAMAEPDLNAELFPRLHAEPD